MSLELIAVLGLLTLAIILFARGRPSMDAVGLIVIAALPLTDVVSVPEVLRGFADPNVVLIAALFVIGEGLVRTGVAQALGDGMAKGAGASEGRLITLLMLAAAGLGSFMSSTGVVAIFIPIMLRIARSTALPPGRLMMPLSMAALISGMMTLVATAPNMVVSAELEARGHEGFSFFAFTPFGIPVLVLAILYMLLVRRRLSGKAELPPPRPGMRDWAAGYGLMGRQVRLLVSAGSDLAGKPLETLDLRASAGVNIVAIERGAGLRHAFVRPEAQTELRGGDILLLDVIGSDFDAAAFQAQHGLTELPLDPEHAAGRTQYFGMAEVIIPSGSSLAGQSPMEARFRTIHDVAVIGVRRANAPLEGVPARRRLTVGDTLLLAGPWRSIRRLSEQRRDMILLDLPEEAEEYAPKRSRAPHMLAVLLAVVVCMATGLLPNAQAALLGCLALGALGIMDMRTAYRSIHWSTLVLIAGMLPFALALERTGGVALAADALVSVVGDAQPRLILAALFAVTAILGLFISNTATAVLMAPVSISIAGTLGMAPAPFAMIVALAASTAFMTPVSSPVNTLVVGPGGYRFMDFMRIGVPFSLITMAVCVLLVPIVLPF
ncbi:SLC13 family permease [Niveispirillum sp. KHB5.9]|uniref:SLC13 family permease n=1 Tax=Niveispirillum sp. KHB5.9 TaxID=3400269 RepID=UPI003A83C9CD